MAENIEITIEERRAALASLTIGQLAREYCREFEAEADIVAGKGELIERLLLKLQHDLQSEKNEAGLYSRGRGSDCPPHGKTASSQYPGRDSNPRPPV
jgi:hypothetical protein